MASEFYNNPRRYKPRNKKRSSYKPRSQRNSTKFVHAVIILVIVGIIILGVMWLMPGVTDGKLALFFGNTESTPEPSVEPKNTPHPMEDVDSNDLIRNISVTDTSFQWFADSMAFGDKLMFTGGEVVNGDACMTALFEVSTDESASRTAKRINIVLENDHILYPVFNKSWLVYLDAKKTGGGIIKCCKQGEDFSNSVAVKEIYTGHPALFLCGNHLAWTERTGTSMDKLYLCDLTTMESSTVQMFNKTTYYGTSKPHMLNKELVWADVDTENSSGSMTSQICILNIETGEFLSYKPGMYAHDPKTSGEGHVAWLTGNHGNDTDLYISKDLGEPQLIESGVMDFYMDEYYLAYQKDEMAYIYIFSTGAKYKLSRNGQNIQLLGASGGCVMWSDITSRSREVPEYAVIPN